MSDAQGLPTDYFTEFLHFRKLPSEGKTGVWGVFSKRSGGLLGTVKWYGAWRQFCFWPEPTTTFNRGCLDDINAFMDTQMRLRAKERASA